MAPLLELRDVSVRFGGNVAVDRVSFSVEAGTVTGLIGPNGAGKTTTFNVITGLEDPASGVVRFDGRDITGLKPHRRSRLGIARTFQRLEVFGSLTARENVKVGAEIRQQWARHRNPDLENEVDGLLELVGSQSVADVRADSLPTGQARLVELARALAIRPRLLLLDEPASGLDERETEEFGQLLLWLASQGVGVLMVEHDVPLVMRLCSSVHVLDFGSVLASGTPAEIQRNDAVLDAYLGAMVEGGLPTDANAGSA